MVGGKEVRSGHILTEDLTECADGSEKDNERLGGLRASPQRLLARADGKMKWSLSEAEHATGGYTEGNT